MGMSLRTRQILVASGLLVLICAWYWWWSRPEVQVPRTFARIQQGIQETSAGLVIDQLHPDYNVAGNWSGQLAQVGEEVPGKPDARALARQGLGALLLMHRDDPFTFSYHIDSLTRGDDGEVTAEVSIQIGTRSGSGAPLLDPPLLRHRFVLARSGWLSAAYLIRSHEPIHLAL